MKNRDKNNQWQLQVFQTLHHFTTLPLTINEKICYEEQTIIYAFLTNLAAIFFQNCKATSLTCTLAELEVCTEIFNIKIKKLINPQQ